MDVSDHTILLFLGIADGNIEDQRLEQIHFGAVPEVIAFLATGMRMTATGISVLFRISRVRSM